MDEKTMVEHMVWLLLDGTAAVWLLNLLFQMARGTAMVNTLELLLKGMCG